MKKQIEKFYPKIVGFLLNTSAFIAPRYAANKALQLFCSPRKGELKPYHQDFLAQFDTKELSVDGEAVMTYHYKGNGPTVLLCHGWESNSFRWRKVFKKLVEQDINIVLMDAPAHGDSGGNRFTAIHYAKTIHAVVNHYNPSVIVGHSVGGYASIFSLYSYEMPSVKKAIIMASPDKLDDITTNYFNIIGGGRRLRKAYEKLIEEEFNHPTSYFNAADFASDFDIPCLIIHDVEDITNRYYEGQSIHKAWKKSQLYTTKGLGHSLQDNEVFDVICQFILN